MSLCKVYNGALIFRVYVGTVTSVPSITGTWLDICDSNSVSDEQLWPQLLVHSAKYVKCGPNTTAVSVISLEK